MESSVTVSLPVTIKIPSKARTSGFKPPTVRSKVEKKEEVKKTEEKKTELPAKRPRSRRTPSPDKRRRRRSRSRSTDRRRHRTRSRSPQPSTSRRADIDPTVRRPTRPDPPYAGGRVTDLRRRVPELLPLLQPPAPTVPVRAPIPLRRSVTKYKAARAAKDLSRSTKEWVEYFTIIYHITSAVERKNLLLTELRQIRWGIRLAFNDVRSHYNLPGTSKQRDNFLEWFGKEMRRHQDCESESDGDPDQPDPSRGRKSINVVEEKITEYGV